VVLETTPSPTGGHILFVDDEPSIVEFADLLLKKLGYTVSTFTRSADAFEAFRVAPKEFDLVITDQTMPGLTGYDLARSILKLRADIPIILISGFTGELATARIRTTGIREVMHKPIHAKDMAEVINRVLQDRSSRPA
jgi:CheY-like chemotaxis protein